MAKLLWDAVGQRFYETGVDRGVLYPSNNGAYPSGVAWNGLTTVTESPSGAESNPQYADNIKYLNLLSAEEFGATIEAFTYPVEFAACDGTIVVNGGVSVGQQSRKSFGLSYRTRVGNDVDGTDRGYKIHLVYGATASPSEKAYATINDSPEAITFSWELTTSPVAVGTIASVTYKPTAILTIDSTKVTAANLATLEDALYGTAGTDPRLPLPAEVIGMFTGSSTTVVPTQPTYNSTTGAVTIPTVTGVVYQVDGETVTGTYTVPVASSRIVTAVPAPTYKFPANTDDDWQYTRA
jgi:hypothetical protein